MEKQPVITQEEFRQQYNERKPHYERLAVNLKEAIKAFLAEKSIPYLDVLARVKDVDSAYEKISRKDYDKPFEQIEDWCGLRIICYYHGDIDVICDVLSIEFDVEEQENTARRLTAHEFGYRSTHLILKPKLSWAVTPNYRGLQDFKAEVQVRTILMHAWAEVEHKLAYKNKEQAPEQFHRKLSRLSAKFEEADEQFEELRNSIKEYRATIRKTVIATSAFRTQKLNLDTLQAFLDVAFPDREGSIVATGGLIQDFKQAHMSMAEVVEGYELAKDTLPKFEILPEVSNGRFLQVGALRTILDVGSDKFFIFRHAAHYDSYSSRLRATMEDARAAIGKSIPSY